MIHTKSFNVDGREVYAYLHYIDKAHQVTISAYSRSGIRKYVYRFHNAYDKALECLNNFTEVDARNFLNGKNKIQ